MSTLQRPVLLLDVSTPHRGLSEEHLDVSGQQEHLLLLEVSTRASVARTRTYTTEAYDAPRLV
jgi:hypothetical protein